MNVYRYIYLYLSISLSINPSIYTKINMYVYPSFSIYTVHTYIYIQLITKLLFLLACVCTRLRDCVCLLATARYVAAANTPCCCWGLQLWPLNVTKNASRVSRPRLAAWRRSGSRCSSRGSAQGSQTGLGGSVGSRRCRPGDQPRGQRWGDFRPIDRFRLAPRGNRRGCFWLFLECFFLSNPHFVSQFYT